MALVVGLEQFVPQLGCQDTKKRLQLGATLLSYLEDPLNLVDCTEMGAVVDGLVAWLNSSNSKVAQNGLEILSILAERLKDDFRPYISTVISAAIDRMGDSKDSVREQAKFFTMKLMAVSSPQYILEKMMPAFSHKNFRIREEVLLCLQDALNAYGPQNLSLMKFMPLIAKLLGDPNSQVRDAAFQTFVVIYIHVGERVRLDLGKKYGIPPAKLQALFNKFDEVKSSGQLLPTATLDLAHRGDDELDRAVSLGKASKRASSAPPNRRAVLATPIKPSQQPSTGATPSTLTRKHSLKGAPPVKAAVSANAGAVDEEMFIRSFEEVPKTQLYSAKELEHELTKVRQVLSDTNTDWERRVDVLRHLRSLLIAGAAEYEELYTSLRLLEPPFQVLVKDLRSQVVREACITIAYLSQQLGHKLDHFSEAVLPALINLIPNSAKIMSTSGIVTVRFIIQHTHVSRLIPVITMNLSSKSKDIRRSCFEFLDQLLHTWPTHTLERHIAILQEAIKKGISDADPEARAFSRKAFWGFADHFKEQADVLLNSLDSSKQRMLQGELCMSNSSSSNSLNNAQARPLKHSVSSHGSMENLRPGSGSSTLGRRSGVPVYNNTRSASVRSNSAIDLGAARRARARAFTTAQNRGIGASLPRPGTKRADTVSSTIASPERISRSRTKGVSQSQPSSRSGSPTSRLSYATYSATHTDSTGRVRRKSGIPTPVGTSREGSPTRPTGTTPGMTGMYERRLSGGTRRPFVGAGERYHPTTITTGAPLMAQQILQQSKEAEAAVADALECWNTPPRKNRYNAFDDQSDESETSSVCSDRSFSSYNRGGYEGHIPLQDVPSILKHLSSIHWSDRKEGLLGLLSVLRSGRTLSLPDLKKVTDMFTKMFMDPHTKVFTLFLEALGELIHVHSADLHSWLYVLLTRLFIKTGTDLLSSLQTKIQKILSIIRECFPHGEQFQAVVRYITDPTQTPNIKVKITILRYLMSLLQAMDSGDLLVNTPETHSMVAKIFSWIRDQKSPELKRHAQEVIVSIFKLRPAEINGLLSRLDPDNQALAMGLIQSYMRGRTDDSELRTPSPITAHVHSPISSTPNRGSRSSGSRSSTPLQRSLEEEEDNTENLNPDELYSSLLRRTTAQIHRLALDPGRGMDLVDSGATPSSRGAELLLPPLGGGSFRQRLAPQNWEEPCTFSQQQRLTGSREASPVKRMASWDYDGETGMHRIRRTSLDGGVGKNEQDTLNNIFAILQNPNSRTEHRKQALSELMPLTKDGSPELWDENFRNVLRCLVENLEEQVVPVKVAALRALAELLKRQPQHFHNYAELTLIKIFGTFKQPEREVSRAAELCSMEAAAALPPEQTMRLLHSLIGESDDQDVVIAAIKVMSRLVEVHPKRIIVELLPQMMPVLLKAYDHSESSVRKAAVFCMVTLHGVVGSELMKPHLASLTGCKLKLLNLYIQRAQGNSSGSTPGSPSNTASSSSNP
ncbi:CLIP-associating protein isoform X2 [Dermacentor variabilis]|uniref:CLIP-associating protein isoform X2 n=1 Tax=Dermacentor variabilis TaxID=34621 RepID=UPI003F5B0904